MTNTRVTVTKVSKSQPAIKAILAATFPQYKNRSVKVVSGPSTVRGYRHARIVNLRTMGVIYVHEAPPVGRSHHIFSLTTSDDHLIVTHDFYGGRDCGITIYVCVGLASDDLAVLVDALLQANGATDTAIAAAMCHQMFPSANAAWGSYDKGHEHVRALDLAWVVAQETAEQLRKGERRAEVG
jgi:hypothetical protein